MRNLSHLDPVEVARLTPARIVIDTRGQWDAAAWQAAGFTIYRLGDGPDSPERACMARIIRHRIDMDFYTRLVYLRRKPLIGKLAYYLLKLLGAEIPCSVPVGEGFELAHGGFWDGGAFQDDDRQAGKALPRCDAGAGGYLPACRASQNLKVL